MAKKKPNQKKKNTQPVNQPTPKKEPVAKVAPSTTLANQELWAKAFSISLLLVFVLMAVLSFWFGLSGDEVDMNEYGKAILNYFTSFGADDTVFHMPPEIDRDGVILYYGGFFDLICAALNKISPFGEYETRHVLNALAGFVAILFSGKIVAMLSDKRIATLTVWLMFLSPFFLGHAMNNPKDIPLAAGYIMAIYFIIRFFERFPDANWKDYLWVILSIGITINVRVAGILLIPYLFVYVGFLYLAKTAFTKETVQLKSYLKPLIIISVLGYLAGSLFWPYGQKNPISNPLEALKVMSNFKVNLAQIWDGEKVYSSQLPQSYLIKSFFITNTYVVIAGILSFLIFIRATFKNNKRHIIWFVAFTALFPLFYIIYKKSNVYHAWRHVLFIFPSLIVMAGLGWQYINDFISRAWKPTVIGLGIAAVLLLEPIIFIVPTFPNTVTYYNGFVGGTKEAYGNYEVDFYYNSVKQCTDYFVEHELPNLDTGKQTWVLSNAFHLVDKYLRQYDNVTTDYMRFDQQYMKKWDYAIFHIALIPYPQILDGSWVPNDAIFVATVKDNPLCVLLKRKTTEDAEGYQALEQGDTDAAIMHFSNYLKDDASNVAVLNTMARIYLQKQDIDNAHYYSKMAYQLNGTDVETQRVHAMVLVNKGEFENALAIFQSIVQQRPDFAAGYYYLGLVQKQLGRYQEAVKNLSIGAQQPDIAYDCYIQMAEIFKLTGDLEQANKMYRLAESSKR